jgi:hypothetical protein
MIKPLLTTPPIVRTSHRLHTFSLQSTSTIAMPEGSIYLPSQPPITTSHPNIFHFSSTAQHCSLSHMIKTSIRMSTITSVPPSWPPVQLRQPQPRSRLPRARRHCRLRSSAPARSMARWCGIRGIVLSHSRVLFTVRHSTMMAGTLLWTCELRRFVVRLVRLHFAHVVSTADPCRKQTEPDHVSSPKTALLLGKWIMSLSVLLQLEKNHQTIQLSLEAQRFFRRS